MSSGTITSSRYGPFGLCFVGTEGAHSNRSLIRTARSSDRSLIWIAAPRANTQKSCCACQQLERTMTDDTMAVEERIKHVRRKWWRLNVRWVIPNPEVRCRLRRANRPPFPSPPAPSSFFPARL